MESAGELEDSPDVYIYTQFSYDVIQFKLKIDMQPCCTSSVGVAWEERSSRWRIRRIVVMTSS